MDLQQWRMTIVTAATLLCLFVVRSVYCMLQAWHCL